MKTEALVVLCTFPDEEKARQIGAVLVEKQAAACVNVLPGLRSIYRWEGKVHDEPEVLAVMKTTRATYSALQQLILELHPYETPEVLALPVEAGSQSYLEWLAGNVMPRSISNAGDKPL